MRRTAIKRTITASEKLYSILKELIINGTYLPGVHLVEADLLKEYQVSRPTIREALRRLIEDEIVELIPHRGILVRKLTTEELKDIYIVLENLEGLAARLVAELDNTVVVEDLEKILEENARAVDNEDFNLHIKLVLDFHEKIAHSTGNGALIKTIERLHLLARVQYATSPFEKRMKASLQSHRNILDAIIAHDADLAEALMRSRLRGSLNKIIEK